MNDEKELRDTLNCLENDYVNLRVDMEFLEIELLIRIATQNPLTIK